MIQLKVRHPHHDAHYHKHQLTPLQSMLNVIDNSGAAVAECINVLKMNRAAKVGKSSSPTPIPPSPLHHSPSPHTQPLTLSLQATASSSLFKSSVTSVRSQAPVAQSRSQQQTKYEEATLDTRWWCEQ